MTENNATAPHSTRTHLGVKLSKDTDSPESLRAQEEALRAVTAGLPKDKN